MTDGPFRLALLLLIVVFLPIAAYYRHRSYTGEPIDRWQEGAFILFGLRLSAAPLLVAAVAWLINPDWMAWSSFPAPLWLRWVGVGIGVCWGLLLVWTFYHLGKNLTDTVVTRKEHSLVTDGPYRFVRHPFYLSGLLGVIGAGLIMANWFMFLMAVVPGAFIAARTPIEERKLVERFGAEYEEYQRRVGQFFPRLW
jgi:protein-S-isoprenylcysteine O-methyltransferase Ste14